MLRQWTALGDSRDDGFTLLEAVLAAVVLMIFASGVFGLIAATLRTSANDRQRVAASNLAARELEIVRNSFRSGNAAVTAIVNQGTIANPDPTGAAGPSIVDGVAYTVTRTAQWATAGTGTSSCDGGATVTYPAVLVNVEVTWPNMGGTQPVRSDTVITPSKDLLNSVYSFVAVKVVDYSGAATPDRPVTMNGPSGTDTIQTDDSGCAVFGLSATGNHVFSLNEGGYVDFTSSAPASQTVAVTSGSFKQVTFTWARSATLNVSFGANGLTLPSPLPSVTVYNASLPSSGTPLNTRNYAMSSTSASISGLGPYTNGYAVWAGGCSDGNPAGSPTNGTASNVVIAPGGNGNANVALGVVAVAGPANTVITATHSGGTCLTGQGTYTLGTTSASGSLTGLLPFGNWVLARAGGASSAVFHPSPAAATAVVVP